MSDPASSSASPSGPAGGTVGTISAGAANSAKKPWFTFTDDGCRTDVRVGGLLVAMGIFLWLFLGPALAGTCLLLPGLIVLAYAIPLQALQGRAGRPGYPWKLGVGMTLLGAASIPDVLYRTAPGGPLHIQETVLFLTGTGLWILAWWPVATLGRSKESGTPS